MTGGFEEVQDLLHDRFADQVIVLPEIGEEYIAGTQAIFRPGMYGDMGLCQTVNRSESATWKVMNGLPHRCQLVHVDLFLNECLPVAAMV